MVNSLAIRYKCVLNKQFIYLSPDPFSTEYLFSMRDEAIFSSRLSVSSGEQHNDFLQTELCLEGTVTYDTNMATVRGSIRL